jgi:hypothetical protein
LDALLRLMAGAAPLREVAATAARTVNGAATTEPLKTAAVVSAATVALLTQKGAANPQAIGAAPPSAAVGAAVPLTVRLGLDVMCTHADAAGAAGGTARRCASGTTPFSPAACGRRAPMRAWCCAARRRVRCTDFGRAASWPPSRRTFLPVAPAL